MREHTTAARELLSHYRAVTDVPTDVFTQTSLTLDDLDHIKKESEDVPQMIFFFAKWCGFCTRMKPAWEAASASKTAKWHVVDCSNRDAPLSAVFKVTSFPTIIGLRQNKAYKFTLERTPDMLVKFASALHNKA